MDKINFKYSQQDYFNETSFIHSGKPKTKRNPLNFCCMFFDNIWHEYDYEPTNECSVRGICGKAYYAINSCFLAKTSKGFWDAPVKERIQAEKEIARKLPSSYYYSWNEEVNEKRKIKKVNYSQKKIFK